MMNFFTFALAFLATLTSFGQAQQFDLVIKNATVFNSRTGELSTGQTILIKDGIISKVTRKQKSYAAATIIDAGRKLVTPGFVDTHIHPTDVYRAHGALPEYLPTDSLAIYRRWLSETYLPYGVTTAMIMGQPEKWLSPVLGWHADPQPQQTSHVLLHV